MTVGTFIGFPPAMMDFLFDLKFNNTTEKLQDNKVMFKRLILEPFRSLYEMIAPKMAAYDKNLIIRSSSCLSSMYTDRRFKPGVPLKDYAYMRFKRADMNADILGFFFDMGFEYYSYGINIYDRTSKGMEKIREYALMHQKRFEKELINVHDKGFRIIGTKYVKDHYPHVGSTVLNDFLNHKYFYIAKEEPLDDVVFSPLLKDEIDKSYTDLRGMFELLVSINAIHPDNPDMV
jgi:uncharacterized protein (DUF2461 family)